MKCAALGLGLLALLLLGASPAAAQEPSPPVPSDLPLIGGTLGILAPGETCEYAFTFSPDSTGGFSVETSHAWSAGKFYIVLLGRSVERWIWVTPLEIDFGPVRVRSESDLEEVRLTNIGPRSMFLSQIGIELAPDSQCQGLRPCSGILLRHASCALQFKFIPREAGEHSEIAEVVSPFGNALITLRGTGVP